MERGVCTLSLIPARREPSGKSELVTQLLFGETYRVQEFVGDWMRIETDLENYPCWISAKQHGLLADDRTLPSATTAELLHPISAHGETILVPLGSTLPAYGEGHFSLNGVTYPYDGATTTAGVAVAPTVIDTCRLFLNAPYLWGGKSILGIDCSGLVQLAFAQAGIRLPRDAYQQVECGTPLSFVEEAEPGDVAFFDNVDGKIVHVGVIIEPNRIIHASGKVRIDPFDHYGIYIDGKKGYTHNLRVIKRITHPR